LHIDKLIEKVSKKAVGVHGFNRLRWSRYNVWQVKYIFRGLWM